MLSLRLQTIRGSFLTEYSGILKGFWTRYQWNYHENPYFVSKMHFPQKVDFDMGLVGNFEMHFFTKDIIFEEISLSPFKQNKNQDKIFNIEKVTAVKKKREKNSFSPVFVPGG